MKKLIIIILLSLTFLIRGSYAQQPGDTTVYMITCAPGTATYSIYGHSALRVVIESANSDLVYNWGIFDFSTRYFAWKFAKGRLNYMLGAYPFDRFLQDYFFENRSVWSQEVNLEASEKVELLKLININMLEENRLYRYDFFYDDCSTRIRDLFEKVTVGKLIYPPDEPQNNPTFRQKLNEYQRPYPWLNFGVDMLMGMQGEKKASFRDRMFLPIEMQKNLAGAVVNRNRKMVPLLKGTVTLLEFDPPVAGTPFYLSPMFVFTVFFIIILILSAWLRGSVFIYYMDMLLFLIFSMLAIMMIFFNFFTDHQQMKMNMNIIWFNPFIIFALFALVLRKPGITWFRLVFFLSILFLPLIFIIPSVINSSFVPLILVIALRSSARAGFQWNPLAVEV